MPYSRLFREDEAPPVQPCVRRRELRAPMIVMHAFETRLSWTITEQLTFTMLGLLVGNECGSCSQGVPYKMMQGDA